MKKSNGIIAIDLTTFSEHFNGGKDQVALNLLSYIQSHGLTDRFVCLCSGGLTKTLKALNINIKSVSFQPVIKDGTKLNYFLKLIHIRKIVNELLILVPRARFIKENNIKLMVFTNKFTSLFPLRIPTLIIPHDIQHLIRHEIGSPIVRFAIRYELFLRDRIICISKYDKAQLTAHSKLLGNRAVQIYNPIVFKPYVDNPYKNKYIVAMNISHPHKNSLTVIEAFVCIAKETDFNFYIVGNYPHNIETLNEIIRGEGLSDRIHFTGIVSDEELEGIYQETRMFVNSSAFEGFGMVAVEMMGSGIPAVVADNSAQREVTRGHATYYPHAENSEELADAIRYELTHPKPLEELKAISEELKEIYNVEKIGAEYMKEFGNMIGEQL